MRKGIMELEKSNDLILLRAGCACYNQDHDATIEVEYNKKRNIININFYKKFYHIKGHKFFYRFWERIKLAFKLLIGKNYITIEDFQIIGEKQITDFIYALERARAEVLKNSNKYD